MMKKKLFKALMVQDRAKPIGIFKVAVEKLKKFENFDYEIGIIICFMIWP